MYSCFVSRSVLRQPSDSFGLTRGWNQGQRRWRFSVSITSKVPFFPLKKFGLFFTVIQTTTTTTTLIPEDFPRGRNHLWLLLVLFDFNSCFKVFKTHLGLLWVTGKDLATFTFQGKDSFGSYVNLHPRMASSIWMPDIFIDQVPPAIFNIVTWI